MGKMRKSKRRPGDYDPFNSKSRKHQRPNKNEYARSQHRDIDEEFPSMSERRKRRKILDRLEARYAGQNVDTAFPVRRHSNKHVIKSTNSLESILHDANEPNDDEKENSKSQRHYAYSKVNTHDTSNHGKRWCK